MVAELLYRLAMKSRPDQAQHTIYGRILTAPVLNFAFNYQFNLILILILIKF